MNSLAYGSKTVKPATTTPTNGNDVGGTYTSYNPTNANQSLTNQATHEYSNQLHDQSATSSLTNQPGALLLDYLRVVLPDEPGMLERIRAWVGVFTARGFGWRGWYDRSWMVLDGGIVARCSNKERAAVEGILVDLPGRACAALGDKLIPFLEWSLSNGKVTRADYAIDDHEGLVTLERITNANDNDCIVTRWTKMSCIKNMKGAGWTVYVGSRNGETMLRVYDKAAEQGVTGHWVRVELETKGKLADNLARLVLSEGNQAVIGQLNRRIRFVEPSSDTNKRRWNTSSWWETFLGSLQPGQSLTAGVKQEATIDHMKLVTERMAAPMIATILQAENGDLDWFAGIVKRGGDRMRAKHYAALVTAKADNQTAKGESRPGSHS